MEDYKRRMYDEYHQTKERYNRLHKMLVRKDAGTLDFEPTCPIGLLREQASHMGQYLYTLEVRAEIEGIDLDSHNELRDMIRTEVEVVLKEYGIDF